MLTFVSHIGALTRGQRSLLAPPILAALILSLGLAALGRLVAIPLMAEVPSQVTRVVDDDGVCGGENPCYSSIQAAVNVAGEHERIKVYPGRYAEGVAVVNKALTIEGPGAGRSDVADDPATHAIWVSPNGNLAPLLVFDARGRSLDGPAVSGFRFRPAGIGVLILGRTLGQAPGWPVPPTSTMTTRISGARVFGNDLRPLSGSPTSAPTAAIAASASDDARLEANSVRGAGVGIWVEDGRGVAVNDNAITDTLSGLWLKDMRSPVGLARNSVTATAATGLVLVDVPNAQITSNYLSSGGVGLRVVQTRPPSPEDLAAIAATGGLVIGGQPGAGNALAGADQALALENGGGPALTKTLDVSATFNAWGTAYAPVIESRVRHAFDDPRLGRVAYWPALGVPAALGLSATPDSLPADGAATAQIVATMRDAAGGLAADDAIVAWSHRGPGELASAAGRVVEAEASEAAGGPARQGEWSVMADAAYGAPSGGSYLHSEQAGASLAFTTTASELALRYAGADAAPLAGHVRVEVDGASTSTIDTRAPERRWLTARAAHDLPAGAHVVTLTLLSGEVSLDLVVGGAPAERGRSVAILRAGADTGEATLTAQTLGEVLSRLEIGVPIVSPPPALLSLSVLTGTLPVGGYTTTVTAALADLLGRPVGDGTTVDFDALLGTIAPSRSRVRGGLAQAIFASGDNLGLAEVRATAGALSATVPITLIAGPPTQLSLSSTAMVLPANSLGVANLTVTAFDRWSHPVPDGTPVVISTTLGTIEDAKGNPLGTSVILPTSGGLIQARLRAGSTAGLAEVRATAGGRAGEGMGGPAAGPGAVWQTVLVMFSGLDLKLSKSVDPHPPAVLTPGEPVYYSLNYENASTSTVPEVVVEDTFPSGLISPSLLTEGPQVEQLSGAPNFRWRIDRLRAGESGRLRVRAIVDTSLRWNSRTTVANTARISSALAAELTPEDNASRAEIGVVPGSAYTVTVSAPEALRVGGATGEVQATVTDRFGNPVIDGTAVFFSTDPALGKVNPAVATTRRGVARTVFTSGTRRGTATVQALSVENRAGLAEILLIAGAAQRLVLTPDRPRLVADGPPATVAVRVDDQYGNGVSGERLDFAAAGATVTPTEATSDASGEVTVTLRPGQLAGAALLTATTGAASQVLIVPIDPGGPAALVLEVNPSEVKMGERTTAIAHVADAFGNPVPGEVVVFSSNIGIVRQAVTRTGADGSASTLVLTYRAGSGTVDASTTGLMATAPLTVVQMPVYLPLAWKPPMRPPR